MAYASQSYVFADAGATSVQALVPVSCREARHVQGTEGKDNYPSTPHLPFSPGVNPDDVQLSDCSSIIHDEVIVTEKLDGGNCCIKHGQIYARTHAQPATHESFSAVKQLMRGFN